MELLVYKASAGSGKTFTLAVEYIKHLIQNPRAYRQILAVTFTNKATAEMKERILQQLYGIWTGDQGSDAYLARIKEDLGTQQQWDDNELRQRAGTALLYMLHDYSRFRVETIDSFFQSVMRNLARELELSPNLNIELNNDEILSQAVDSLIEKLTPTSPVLAWLLDYINERIADDKRWNVSDEVKSFARNIFNEEYIERGEALRLKMRSPQVVKLYRELLQGMEAEATKQMKALSERFEAELDGRNLSPDDLKNGSRGIGSYFRKLRDGKLSDKDVLNATLQNCLADAANWTTKTSSRKDDIIRLAQTTLIPLLEEAERLRPRCCRTINSCLRIGTVIALLCGVAAALSRRADAVLSWCIDLFLGIPHILLVMLISLAFGRGFLGVVAGVSLSHWPSLARVIRGEVLSLRHAPYLLAAEKLGPPRGQIVRRHLLPHLLPQFLTGLILQFPHAILHEASVTFLGFGLSSEQPAIGVILSESMQYLTTGRWWLALFPGLALVGVVLLFAALGEQVRRVLDPSSVHQ